MKNLRKKIWIDRFQTHLFLRIGCYCVLYQAAVWMMVALEDSISIALQGTLGPRGATLSFVLIAIVALVLGGLFICDGIRFAHRIVGPVYRFRKTVQAITAGEVIDPVRLRQGDYLLDMKDDFNEMLRVLAERGALTLNEGEPKSEERRAA